MDNRPLVSVITVVYNDCLSIEATINSIINQSYTNFEYVIIDGGSNDGTLDIIRNYKKYTSVIISEKDYGIYDAMNKGIKNAQGEYIIFMNSGDRLYDKDVILNIINVSPPVDLIYGGYEIEYQNGFNRSVLPRSFKNIEFGMPIHHQTLFVKRDLLLKWPFDMTYKVAADYNFLCKCFLENSKIFKVNLLVAIITTGGVSDNKIRTLTEHYLISRKINNSIFVHLYYCYQICSLMIKNICKRILPDFLITLILKLK